MKAVILAAGRGKRMRPLTDKLPKPMVKIGSKIFLDHALSALSPYVNEVVVVVGYLGDKIIEHLNRFHPDLSVRFVKQTQLDGTGAALQLVCPYIKKGERFIVCYADEYFTADDVCRCLVHESSWITLVVPHPERAGVPDIDDEGKIVSVVEKPTRPTSNRVVGGLMVLNDYIFDCVRKLSRHENGEYILSEAMNEYVIKNNVYAVAAQHNYQFSTNEDVNKFTKT